jgi:restriction endonuclease S subunit
MTAENTTSYSKERNRLALGWALTNYDESVDTISDQGRRVDQARYLKDGCVPVIDQGEAFIGGYTDDESKRYEGPLPIIVFGDHTRRVKYVDFPFVVGAQGVKLLMPRECWFPKFFSYLLPTLDIRDRGYSRHFQFIRKLEFPLPPLAEQRRIVAEIEKQCTRLDAAVEALKRVRANLKRYRASVLKAACEGRLVPTEAGLARAEGRDYEPADVLLQRTRNARTKKSNARRGRHNLDDLAETASLGVLPEGWIWTSLSELADIQGGIQKQPSRRPVRNPYPFLRVANVLRGRLDLTEIHRIELFGDENTKLRLQPGDLLIVEGNGSRSEIGRMAIWDAQISDCVHQNHIIRARLLGGTLPAYLSAYWNAPNGSQCVFDIASSTSGLYTLSVGKVSRIPVPLPPLAEQRRIVAEIERRLSVIEEIEALANANLKRAERLRQSILKRAFEGNLVPQDPNDEPASVLLERIRAERAAKAERGNSSDTEGKSRLARRKTKVEPITTNAR